MNDTIYGRSVSAIIYLDARQARYTRQPTFQGLRGRSLPFTVYTYNMWLKIELVSPSQIHPRDLWMRACSML